MKKRSLTHSIDISINSLRDMGVELHLGLTSLNISFDTAQDQEFDDFLGHIPDHLSDMERAEMIRVIEAVYCRITIARCFSAASDIHRSNTHEPETTEI